MKRRKLNKLAGSWKPWDYGYNLEIEREMFRKQAGYFAKSNLAVGDEERGKKCKLLVKLLDIIIDDSSDLVLVDPYRLEKSNNTYTIRGEQVWKMNRYVNIKNANRFFNKYELKIHDVTKPLWQNELREQKAWCLYHKLRMYFMKEFWN